MSKKKLWQLISIVFLVASAILSVPGTNWKDIHSTLAFVSLLLGIIGSIISIFIPTNYTHHFVATDWVQGANGDASIFIKASTHGQGTSPNVQLFMVEDDNYELAEAAVSHDKTGNITVSGSESIKCSGKLIIS